MSRQINNAHLEPPRPLRRHLSEVFAVATDAKILESVASVIGHPTVLLINTAFFIKLPAAGGAQSPRCQSIVGAHQDRHYWAIGPADAKLTSIWIAIDDVDADNGAMEFFPGSRSEALPHEKYADECSALQDAQRIPSHLLGPGRSAAMQKGEYMIFDSWVAHQSGRNFSPRRRVGLTLIYAPGNIEFAPMTYDALEGKGEQDSQFSSDWRKPVLVKGPNETITVALHTPPPPSTSTVLPARGADENYSFAAAVLCIVVTTIVVLTNTILRLQSWIAMSASCSATTRGQPTATLARAGGDGGCGEHRAEGSLEHIVSPKYLGLDADATLVESTRRALSSEQIVVLDEFLLPEVVRALAQEALSAAEGVRHGGVHFSSPYYKEPDPSLPSEHPKNASSSKSMRYVTRDLIGRTSALRQLHESRHFTRFLSACTGASELHHYGCNLSKLVFSVHHEGDHQDWHFDNNWLTLTFMLQRPDGGGAFEVLPMLRCETGDGENFEGVRRVLETDRCGMPDARLDKSAVEGVRRIDYSLGCLVIFKGRHSLHRATRVLGSTPRVIGILSYSDDSSGGAPSREHLEQVYGKTTNLDSDAATSISVHGRGRAK